MCFSVGFNIPRGYWTACVYILRAGSEDPVLTELVIRTVGTCLGQPGPCTAQASGTARLLRKAFVINRVLLSSSLFFPSPSNRNWHNHIWDNDLNEKVKQNWTKPQKTTNCIKGVWKRKTLFPLLKKWLCTDMYKKNRQIKCSIISDYIDIGLPIKMRSFLCVMVLLLRRYLVI